METKAREDGRDLHERPRAVTQRALDPQPLPAAAAQGQDLSLIASSARRSGVVAAFTSGLFSGAAVLAANTFSPRFRKFFGISGKTALVVTPMFGAFTLKSHLSIASATADRDGFLAARPQTAAPEPVRQQHLTVGQTIANAVYLNPFKTIFGIAGPMYAGIFYKESTDPRTASMLLSQRLIHTRVYGQAIAIFTTVAVMGWAETMEGPYRISNGLVTQSLPPKDSSLRVFYEQAGPSKKDKQQSEQEVASSGPSYDLLVPLLYAPLLPLMIVGFGGGSPKTG